MYCQQSFPFIGGPSESFNAASPPSVKLTGGNYGVAANPLIIDVAPWTKIEGSQLSTVAFNMRIFDLEGHAYGQTATPHPIDPIGQPSRNQLATVARRSGRWGK